MDSINNLWLATATVLVLFMQAGFLLLEAGRVRAKNSVNVAQKNVSDLVVSWTAFFAIGYGLMFGLPVPFGLGMDSSIAGQERISAMLTFLYQLGFCATAASIVSGGVAERCSFRAYLILAGITAAFIYPVVGRWVWGGLEAPLTGSWLANIGFIDFAGSTVVHGVGAWISLAAIITIGPRLGRFDDAGNVLPIPGHNAVIAMLGILILFFGWFGFNAGTLSPSDPLFAQVLLNTCASACFGALAGMIAGSIMDKGVFNPSRVTSGLIGGLVAVTACAHFALTWQASLIGLLGGLTATVGSHWLLHRWRLDDPLDVVATHGVAGVVGTLSVAFVAPVSALAGGTVLTMLGVQLLGIVSVFLFTFCSAWTGLRLVGQFTILRVGEQAERIGLNHSEHGEAMGAERLQRAINERIDENGNFADPFQSDDGGDAGELAHTLNQLLAKHEQARIALKNSQLRFKDFARTASDWLWEADTADKITFISASNGDDSESLQSNFIGHNLNAVLRLRRDDRQLLKSCIESRETLQPVEASISKPGVGRILIEVRGVPHYDEAGVFMGYRGTMNDITERRSAERRALFLSRHDELTGLANRRALADDLQATINTADSLSRGVLVVAVDLDGFKAVNDAYGHGIGDALLRAVAKRVNATIRGADRLYRTGGDEFVMVFPEYPTEEVLTSGIERCEDLIQFLSQPFDVHMHKLELGASIGIASYPQHSKKPADLLRMADLALYAAKENGKGCAFVFNEKMDNEAQHQMRIESDLRKAVEQDEFFLEYQPQYDSNNRRLIGFEALVRWDHPSLGRLAPDAFIPIAEKLKLMDNIGAYALNEACRFATEWPTPEPNQAPLQVAVNVSPSQFLCGRIVDDVVGALSRSGLPAAQLELEITEDLIIDDFALVKDLLNELRTLGVSIAIDDFGSGQASLAYLNQFPINKLKIDRAFVQHLGSDDRADDITHSIVMLGHKLGCTVVAEGIEHADQASLLKSWKCDHLQGFMFSKPLPPADVNDLIESLMPISQDS